MLCLLLMSTAFLLTIVDAFLFPFGDVLQAQNQNTYRTSSSWTDSSPYQQKRFSQSLSSSWGTRTTTSNTELAMGYHRATYGRSSSPYRKIGGRSRHGRNTNYLDGDERTKRQERVGHLVRTEVGQIVHSGILKGSDRSIEYLDDHLRHRISMVHADVSPDLRQCRLTFSVTTPKRTRVRVSQSSQQQQQEQMLLEQQKQLLENMSPKDIMNLMETIGQGEENAAAAAAPSNSMYGIKNLNDDDDDDQGDDDTDDEQDYEDDGILFGDEEDEDEEDDGHQDDIDDNEEGEVDDGAVYYSNPTIVDQRRAHSWLVKHAKQIRHTLAQRLSHMKSIPELTFHYADVGAAVDVMDLIDRLGQEKEQEHDGESTTSTTSSTSSAEEDLQLLRDARRNAYENINKGPGTIPRGMVDGMDFDEDFENDDEWDEDFDFLYGDEEDDEDDEDEDGEEEDEHEQVQDDARTVEDLFGDDELDTMMLDD